MSNDPYLRCALFLKGRDSSPVIHIAVEPDRDDDTYNNSAKEYARHLTGFNDAERVWFRSTDGVYVSVKTDEVQIATVEYIPAQEEQP